jgi:hypothetical protein
MAKKVVMDPADFEKLVNYITSQTVNYAGLEKALEIKKIMLGVKLVDLLEAVPDSKDAKTK